MDFALSEEQTAIFEMARDFGAARIAPHARAWEAEGSMPRDLWADAAALGFGGIYVSEAAGGAGLSRLDATLVFEALSMACPSIAAFLSIHNMCAAMIDRHGSEDLKARFLPGAVSMETVLSYALTEPGSGSDAAALRTRAERTEDGWRLDGTKAFISGGGYSAQRIGAVPEIHPPWRIAGRVLLRDLRPDRDQVFGVVRHEKDRNVAAEGENLAQRAECHEIARVAAGLAQYVVDVVRQDMPAQRMGDQDQRRFRPGLGAQILQRRAEAGVNLFVDPVIWIAGITIAGRIRQPRHHEIPHQTQGTAKVKPGHKGILPLLQDVGPVDLAPHHLLHPTRTQRPDEPAVEPGGKGALLGRSVRRPRLSPHAVDHRHGHTCPCHPPLPFSASPP